MTIPLGLWDTTGLADGWFDETRQAVGWWDADLLDAGGVPPATAKVITAALLNRKTIMAQRGVAMTVEFLAWDTSANAPKTGDSANITLRWVKDGTSAALTTTTVTEVDSTNCPGLYKCDLSATETDCKVGMLHGKSATANIYIMPVEFGFVYTPTAAFTAPTNFSSLSIDGSGRVDVIKVAGTTQTARDLGGQLDAAVSTRMATFTLPTNFSALAITVGGAVTAGTVSDKTGYSLTQAFPTNFSALAITVGGAVTAGTVSDKTGYALTSGERDSVADALLARNVSGGSSTGRTVKQALHFLRNKWTVSAGTLTVYDTDDTTSSWTGAVTGTAGADPVTASDPT